MRLNPLLSWDSFCQMLPHSRRWIVVGKKIKACVSKELFCCQQYAFLSKGSIFKDARYTNDLISFIFLFFIGSDTWSHKYQTASCIIVYTWKLGYYIIFVFTELLYTTEFTSTTEFMSTDFFFNWWIYLPKPNLTKANLTLNSGRWT